MVKDELPLKPPEDEGKEMGPAPAFVALGAAWVGLIALVFAIVVPLVPGSREPVRELTHQRPYSLADQLVLVPVYAAPLAMALGAVVIWRMRRERRPLPAALLAQRVQAWVGIVLGLLAAAVVYGFVALRGPGGHL